MDIEKYQDLIAELKYKAVKRVLFICLGNICRSPAADGIMQARLAERRTESRWEVDSAGIGAWHTGQLPDQRMRVHARRRGYDLTHRARQVRAYDFENFDIIVAMDDSNVADLKDVAPTLDDEKKIVRMIDFVRNKATRYDSVPDPYYEGAEGFELVLDLLEDAIDGLVDTFD